MYCVVVYIVYAGKRFTRQQGERKMATRTAPAIDGSPTIVSITARLIDNEGDLTSVQMYVPTADYTDLLAEAFITDLQAASQASIYEVLIENQYIGAKQKVNADADQRSTVHDVVNLRYNSLEKVGLTVPVPAPQEALFTAGTNDPDPNEPLLAALQSAIGNLKFGFFLVSLRYNQQRDINQAIIP